MSDEEHQFESKVDAEASKTYPQQAGCRGFHFQDWKAYMVMLNVTLLQLISSLARNLKILFLHLTTVIFCRC